jgi:hypothetical protein
MRLRSPIEGLLHVQSFLTVSEHAAVFDAARRLSDRADAAARGLPRKVSPKHNVNSREEYTPVTLAPGLTCDHFTDYADGHRLSYFRQTEPFPYLGLKGFRARVAALPGVAEALATDRVRTRREKDSSIACRLTLNVYPPSSDSAASGGASKSPDSTNNRIQHVSSERPGFPWHRDLRANGAVSVILGLNSPTTLEFGEERREQGEQSQRGDGIQYQYGGGRSRGGDQFEHVGHGSRLSVCGRVRLCPADALVLSGHARWELMHRVVPEPGGDLRASLVFGLW